MIHQAFARTGDFQQYEACFDSKSIDGAAGWIDVVWLLAFASGRSFYARVSLQHMHGFLSPPEPIATVGFRYPRAPAS